MKCHQCKSREIKKESEYTFFCNNCLLKFSNLSAGFGAPIQGISNLRKINFNKILNFLKRKKYRTILDVGTNNGQFVYIARAKGFKAFGLEPNRRIKKILKIKHYIYNYGLPIKNKFILKKKFDVIIFNDSFEHIPIKKIDLIFTQLNKMLKTRGIICFNMPSYDGLFYKIADFFNKKLNYKVFYERLWQKNLSSPHTMYFNKQSLNFLLEKYKYQNLYFFYLESVVLEGLIKRIKSTFKKKFIIFILFLFVSIIRIFNFNTKDIIFSIYKKNNY